MDGEECVGFGAVRFLNSASESNDLLFNDPKGSIAWVEMVIGTVKGAVQTLMVALVDCVKRVGANVSFLGGEDILTKKTKLYPFDRYVSLVIKHSYKEKE